MDGSTLRKMYIKVLNTEYKKRCRDLSNYVHHISNLYDILAITSDDRSEQTLEAENLLVLLNSSYEKSKKWINSKVSNKQLNGSLEQYLDIYNFVKKTDLEILGIKHIDFYKEFDSKIKKSVAIVALPNCYDNILLFDTNIANFKYLETINKYFVPFITKYNEDKKTDNIEIKEYEDVSYNYEYIPSNVYEILIPVTRGTVRITGFFRNDVLSVAIKTSKVCSKFIYDRYKKICSVISSKGGYGNKFTDLYIKSLTIEDIIVNTEDTIINTVDVFHKLYLGVTTNSFDFLLHMFKKADLKEKLKLLKCMIICGGDYVDMAGLLYGLTKDRRESIDSSSKPTFLSELLSKNLEQKYLFQLRNSGIRVREEVERIESMVEEEMDIKTIISVNKTIPDNIKITVLKKLDELKNYSGGDYNRHMEYVKILSKFPWDDDNDIFKDASKNMKICREMIDKCKNILNYNVYGHKECKQTVIEILGKWFTNGKSKGMSIGLCGPPGVGKTLIAQSIGKALGIPLAQINLGGTNDGGILSGHSFTYTGAQPGLIVKKMVENGKRRCILFFDELDKTGKKGDINEILNILIHATDPNTNHKFNDLFFSDITFPLDKVLFIFSYNDQGMIDRILLDRIKQINVKPYSIDDKLKIVNDYVIKELATDIGVNEEDITVTNDAISILATDYTLEAGVRDIKRKLETIMMKLNVERIYNRISRKLVINKNTVKKYLESPNLEIRKVHQAPQVGVVNGLYATAIGIGGIMPIIIYDNHVGEDFTLEVTGNQGNVMKESISFAFSVACNILRKDSLEKYRDTNATGFHIHTPDGSTNKDGPSAGLAFTVAFVSRLLNIPIKNKIAMTGEIDLNGDVTKIGGLEYKLLGAKKAGCNLVFIPKGNYAEFRKLDKKLLLTDSNFIVKSVNSVKTVLDFSLIESINSTLNKKSFNHKDYLRTTI